MKNIIKELVVSELVVSDTQYIVLVPDFIRATVSLCTVLAVWVVTVSFRDNRT